MKRRAELIEDILLIIGIVIVFGTVFSVTLAFKDTEPQPTRIVYSSTPIQADASEKTAPTAPIQNVAALRTHLEETEDTPEPTPAEEVNEPKKSAETEVLPLKKSSVDTRVATVRTTPTVESSVIKEDSTNGAFIQELASLIQAKTNAFRKKNGLSSLMSDSALAQIAQTHSRQMLKEDFFSHTNTSGCDFTCRFEASGYAAEMWGENLGEYTFSDFPRAESVASYFMNGWQKSSGHRKNILTEAFTNQGIGIAMDRKTIYVTVDFAQPMP